MMKASAAKVTDSPSANVVSQRLTELLLTFPAAAIDGVEWSTLIQKYNDRHKASLDLQALGFDSALAAVPALLWEVVRVVSSKDTSNPLLMVQDCEAMVPTPKAAATWPSLYASLVTIVTQSAVDEKGAQAVLVSQLKPLLQQHWHCDFDEAALNYNTKSGKAMKMKKMKHLLQGILQWREERRASGSLLSSKSGKSQLDAALEMELELVPSEKHHDLLLRSRSSAITAPGSEQDSIQYASSESIVLGSDIDSSGDSAQLRQKIAQLQAENAWLRLSNMAASQQQCALEDEELQTASFNIPTELVTNVWDDPSEPPPFEYSGSKEWSSCGSTAVPSSAFNSGDCTSVAATPTTWVWDGQKGHICSMVPMFYVVGDRGLHNVPSGFVQAAIDTFESNESSKVIPSYFTMGVRQF